MAICYHRKLAWLTSKGLSFKPVLGAKRLTVPCGKCLACRANNASQWATRVMHEAEYVDTACFITLTYSPDYVPSDYSLRKSDLQKFLKRLRITLDRQKLGHIRAYLACGEYGSKRGRPHYHVLLLGWSPHDLQFYSTSYSGEPIYTSKFLESIWRFGFCPVGTLTGRSAAYVARYSKKLLNNAGNRLKPFVESSRRIPLVGVNGSGAIGSQWVVDNHKVLRLGYVHHPEHPDVKVRIPEYYFDLLKKWWPDEYEAIKDLRLDFVMESFGGLDIVEDDVTHKPSILFHVEQSDSIDQLRKFVSVSDPSVPLEDLLNMAKQKVQSLSRAQDDALSKLERGLE